MTGDCDFCGEPNVEVRVTDDGYACEDMDECMARQCERDGHEIDLTGRCVWCYVLVDED